MQKQIDSINRRKELLQDIVDDTQTQIDRDKADLEERKKALEQELQILEARKQIAHLQEPGADTPTINPNLAGQDP